MGFSLGVGDICKIKLRLTKHSSRVGPALTGELGGNERHPASPRSTWRGNKIKNPIYVHIKSVNNFANSTFIMKICTYIRPDTWQYLNLCYIVMGPLPTHSWTLLSSILIESQVLSRRLDTLPIFD